MGHENAVRSFLEKQLLTNEKIEGVFYHEGQSLEIKSNADNTIFLVTTPQEVGGVMSLRHGHIAIYGRNLVLGINCFQDLKATPDYAFSAINETGDTLAIIRFPVGSEDAEGAVYHHTEGSAGWKLMNSFPVQSSSKGNKPHIEGLRFKDATNIVISGHRCVVFKEAFDATKVILPPGTRGSINTHSVKTL